MAQEQTAKKPMSKKEAAAFLSQIEQSIVASDKNYMHAMLALNEILRQANAAKLLDKNLKDQARDLWLKIRGMGLELDEPPLLG